MGNVRFLKMSEHLDHSSDKKQHIFSVEEGFALGKVSLEVCHTFFHLNVAFFDDDVSIPSLLLEHVIASILDYIGMRMNFYFGKELDFFHEDELLLLLVKSNFLDALDSVFLIGYFVNNAVAGAYDLSDPKAIKKMSISPQELDCFIVHQYVIC